MTIWKRVIALFRHPRNADDTGQTEWCAGGGASGPGDGRHYEAFDFEEAGTEPRWRAVMQEPFKGTTVPGSYDDQARGDGR